MFTLLDVTKVESIPVVAMAVVMFALYCIVSSDKLLVYVTLHNLSDFMLSSLQCYACDINYSDKSRVDVVF